jgi:hypothetical protein
MKCAVFNLTRDTLCLSVSRFDICPEALHLVRYVETYLCFASAG